LTGKNFNKIFRLKKEIYDVFKNTSSLSTENIDQLKKENQDFQTIMNWLEEYSTIKINDKDNIAKVKLKNNLHANNRSNNMNNIPLTAVKTYLRQDDDRCINTLRNEFVSIPESSIITIEDPSFDIFKLEDEVGQEHTLSTVSCYIFTSMGLYSMIDYEKFEHFIKAITKGYTRDNPYHHVNFL
jgi:hypothetical protein